MKRTPITKRTVILLAITAIAASAFLGCKSDEGGSKKPEHPTKSEHPK